MAGHWPSTPPWLAAAAPLVPPWLAPVVKGDHGPNEPLRALKYRDPFDLTEGGSRLLGAGNARQIGFDADRLREFSPANDSDRQRIAERNGQVAKQHRGRVVGRRSIERGHVRVNTPERNARAEARAEP